jgi:hypothetical protein
MQNTIRTSKHTEGFFLGRHHLVSKEEEHQSSETKKGSHDHVVDVCQLEEREQK